MENNNFNQNSNSQFNQQYNQYGQQQYSQQQYSQQQYSQQPNQYGHNMCNPQQIYQSTQNLNKSGNKIIALIIAGIITLMLTVGIIIVSIFSIVAKPKDAIKEHLIEDYLYENNIEYSTCDIGGMEYGEGICYDTDDFNIFILECESDTEAKKEFNALDNEIIELEGNWSFSTNSEGSNYDKKVRYLAAEELGLYLIRVDETVLYIDAYTEDAWDTVKDMMDELNY